MVPAPRNLEPNVQQWKTRQKTLGKNEKGKDRKG